MIHHKENPQAKHKSDNKASSAVETVVIGTEWVDVDDGLPEIGTPVLVYSNSIARYPYDCEFDIAIFKGLYHHSVWDEKIGKEVTAYKWPLFEIIDTNNTRQYTHWMPLPNPPK